MLKLKLSQILLLSLLLFSCQKDDDVKNNSSEVPHKKLTLLVFNPKCNLYSTLEGDYRSIIQNIYENNRTSDVQLLRIVSKESLEDENYYLIETKLGKDISQNDTIKHYRFSELDYTTLDGLKRILSDVKSVQKGDSIGMIIGCHGSGWIPLPKKNKTIAKAFGSDSRYNGTYNIYFQTLATALQESGLWLKFLSLDCCNSQNIENAYLLRHVTRWILGSPTDLLAESVSYEKNFYKLLNSDYIGFGQSYIDYYRSKNERATYSVVDTEKFDDLIRVMRTINDQYYEANIERVSGEAKNKDVQPLGGSFYDPEFIDFQDYVYHLCDNEQLRKDFDAALSKLVVWKDSTKKFLWNSAIKQTYELNVFSGISTSEPVTSLRTEMQETEWYKATHSNVK